MDTARMQVSVQTTNGLERKATVTLPSDSVEELLNESLKSAASDLKLPGFRPGKVPLKEVRRRIGPALRREVATELSRTSFAEAMTQEGLSLASEVSIEIKNMEAGEDLRYEATFEVLPDIELVDLATLRISQPVTQIAEEDVDATVESIRQQRVRWHPAERPAALGDRLLVSMTTQSSDDEARPREVTLELGQEEGSEHNPLVGAVVGETRTLPTASRPSHHDPDLDEHHDDGHDAAATADRGEGVSQLDAGEGVTQLDAAADERVPQATLAVAEVTVKSIEAPHLPDVDDEFMEWYGIEAGEDRPARFRAAVRERMELELAAAKRKAIRREVMSALLRAHDFEVPKALERAEYRSEMARMEQVFEDVPERAKAAGVLAAGYRVRTHLLMREIAARESVQLDDERVRKRIEEIAGSYEESAEVRRFLYGDEEQLRRVEGAVLEEQVLDLVLSRAQQVAVPMSYQALVAGQRMPPLDEPDEESPGEPREDMQEELPGVNAAPATAGRDPDAGPHQEPAAAQPSQPPAKASKGGLFRRLFKRS